MHAGGMDKPRIRDLTKVTVTITPEKFVVTCWAGEEKVARRVSRMESEGESTAVRKGDFEDDFEESDGDEDEEIDESIASFLNDLSDLQMAGFGIAGRLWRNAELRGKGRK